MSENINADLFRAMSSRSQRGRKREAAPNIGRPSKRAKRDTVDHVRSGFNLNFTSTFQVSLCSELFSAIKGVRDSDGRPITDTLQRAPSRRNEPNYYNAIEKAIDLSRINQVNLFQSQQLLLFSES
jgi:hypothetical protein